MRLKHITGYKFARISDFVFSEVLTKDQFKKINPQNIHILYQNNSHICYQRKEIVLSDNNVVFSINNSLDVLFDSTKKINVKNLTLITSQTDHRISKKVFSKLPEQFTSWYSINVDHINENLHPIPLGISNGYEKSINFEKNFIELNTDEFKKPKENLLYLSFEERTNIRLRSGLKDFFTNFEWVKIESNKNSLSNYEHDLKNSNFILCPQGNGIDTHRIWESLYFGTIPIIKKHKNFNDFDNLPVLFVDDFYDLNEQLLLDYLKNLKNYQLTQIDFDYWKNKILINDIQDLNKTSFKINEYKFNYFLLKDSLKSKISKWVNGYYRIVYKLRSILNIQ